MTQIRLLSAKSFRLHVLKTCLLFAAFLLGFVGMLTQVDAFDGFDQTNACVNSFDSTPDFSGSGPTAAFIKNLLCQNVDETMFACENFNNQIRSINLSGMISTYLDDRVIHFDDAATASFGGPKSIWEGYRGELTPCLFLEVSPSFRASTTVGEAVVGIVSLLLLVQGILYFYQAYDKLTESPPDRLLWTRTSNLEGSVIETDDYNEYDNSGWEYCSSGLHTNVLLKDSVSDLSLTISDTGMVENVSVNKDGMVVFSKGSINCLIAFNEEGDSS